MAIPKKDRQARHRLAQQPFTPRLARPEIAEPDERAAEDRVRQRAHQLYLARVASGAAGDDVADWLQAERELNGHSHEPPFTSRVLT